MTMQEFVHWYNNATKEEIAQAMEKLPTDALEWGIKFEAMSHAESECFPQEIVEPQPKPWWKRIWK